MYHDVDISGIIVYFSNMNKNRIGLIGAGLSLTGVAILGAGSGETPPEATKKAVVEVAPNFEPTLSDVQNLGSIVLGDTIIGVDGYSIADCTKGSTWAIDYPSLGSNPSLDDTDVTIVGAAKSWNADGTPTLGNGVEVVRTNGATTVTPMYGESFTVKDGDNRIYVKDLGGDARVTVGPFNFDATTVEDLRVPGPETVMAVQLTCGGEVPTTEQPINRPWHQ